MSAFDHSTTGVQSTLHRIISPPRLSVPLVFFSIVGCGSLANALDQAQLQVAAAPLLAVGMPCVTWPRTDAPRISGASASNFSRALRVEGLSDWRGACAFLSGRPARSTVCSVSRMALA